MRAEDWARALPRLLLLLFGVLVVQAGHGDALGGPNGVLVDPEPPPVLPAPLLNPIVPSERAGNLAGTSAVTPTGQYTYRLPIDVPPGRAGLQPSLELRYSSGLGNGHLGVGWSLAGLSEIRRCHKTWATEGFADGVDFDDTDAFCLDGQKLRQINSQQKQNGHDGAEYRTERDTFARITAHGDTALGPNEFLVEAKNGLVFKYDFRVEPHRLRGGFPHEEPQDLGAVRAVWLLREVWDRSGNAMAYDYHVDEDPETRGVDYRIKAVHYTAKHVDGSEPAGALRTVEFLYGKREAGDDSFRYESGVRWETRFQLDTIRLWAPDPVTPKIIGEYRLSYTASPDTGRTRLSAVGRCDAEGVCLRAKNFRWWERSIAGEPPEFQEVPITPFDTATGTLPDVVLVADFNGDGLDDVLYRAGNGAQDSYGPIYLHFAQRAADGALSFGPEIVANAQGHEFSDTDLRRSRAADIDGDGAAEVFAAINPDIDVANPIYVVPGYQIFRWNAGQQAFLPVGELFDADPVTDAVQLTDFDGDGRIDLFREQADLSEGSGASDLGKWQTRRNVAIPGNDFHFSPPDTLPLLSVQGAFARAFDVDGDGRGDLLPIDWNSSQDGSDDTGVIPGVTIKLGLDDTADPATDDAWRLRNFARMQLVDLNGDGLRDALYPFGPGTQVRWNLGLGFGPLTALPSPIVPVDSAAMAPDLGLRPGDFDGDGAEDLVSFDNGGDLPTEPKTRLFRFRGDHIEAAELGVEGALPEQHLVGEDTHVQDGWPYCTTGDFDGDGLTDLLHTHVESTTDADGTPHAAFQLWASIRQRFPSDVLLEISDEDSPTPAVSVFYDRVRPETDGSCAWPQRCARRGIEVVTLTATAAGGELPDYRFRRYSYEDARMDLQGRGFLGFGKVAVFDEALRAYTVTAFDNATRVSVPTGGTLYPYAGLPATVRHYAPIFQTPGYADSTPPQGSLYPGRITTVTYHYNQNTPNDPDALWSDAAAGTFVVHGLGSTTIEFEAPVEVHGSEGEVTLAGPGAPEDFREVDMGVVYDAFENPVFVSRMTSGGTYSWTATTYENRVADWLLGLPLHTETTTEDLSNPAEEARAADYHFDELGRLEWVQIEPGHDELRRTTSFARDSSGLPLTIAVTTADGTRKTFLAYDDLEGIFPRARWNPLAHYERTVYHPAFGVPVLTEDPNGVRVTSTYDGFGRIRSVTPDGDAAMSISYLSNGCKTSAAQKGVCTEVQREGGGQEVAYSDEYGRVWETGELGFDGTLVFRRQRYNLLGQPVEIARPFTDYEGGVTKATFDSLGRPVQIEAPDTTVTSFDYQGLFATTATDPNGHKTAVLRDVDGRVVTTWDAAGAPTRFEYGPFDQIASIEDSQGNKTVLGYDKLGRRRLLVDPDQGTTTFEHDAFGELRFVRHHVEDQDSKADLVTEYRHDILGRVYRRLDTYGADPPVTDITEYQYDNGPHALGKLVHTTSPDGIETAHSYDLRGRPSETAWKIDGAWYSIGREYDDATGRIAKLAYPSQGEAFEIGFHYNVAGWLHTVFRPTSPVTASLWQVQSRNLDGMLTAATWVGPGVVEERTYSGLTGRLHNIVAKGDETLVDLTYAYDLAGNVAYRRDGVAGRTELFGYDERDRLSSWQLTVAGGPGAQVQRTSEYRYDDLGNLTKVTEDGSLTETHAVDPAHPHRLASLDLPGAGTRTYVHDARGREHADSDGRIIEYTPFDLPRHVSRPDPSVPGATATYDFAYDAFGARVKKTATEGGAITTTITLAGLYERRERVEPNGTATIQDVYYVPGDGSAVAQVVYDETTTHETVTYLARDGLGSVAVAFDQKLQNVERYYHEPFGGRIGADGKALVSFSSKAGVSLGFTGQYHDDDLGLIDMNGRVYDPVQKRFLTPDPFVPDPLDSQSYNRYAYVLNNPLSYTDPSGFDEKRIVVTTTHIAEPAMKVAEAHSGPKPAPAPAAPPPPPPAKPTSPGGDSDMTGATPPTSPGTGSLRPADNPGDDTGGPDTGGMNEGTTGDIDEPSEPEPSWRDNAWIQGVGGFVTGLGLGFAPGGAPVDAVLHETGVTAKGTREANIGKGLGEFVGGALSTGLGIGGSVGGGALSATGIGAVAGVPAIAVSTGLVASGVVNMGVGLTNLHTALSTGSGPGSADYTAKNFRPNLARLTGKAPANAQAHHVFPQKFGDVFRQRFHIDIHDPRYGAWWDAAEHAKSSARYNEEWVQFLRDENVNAQGVFDFARELAGKYGFTLNF